MIHAPDADEYFGKTPYKGEMPSVDAPKEHEAMIKGTPQEVDDQLSAVALFLATQGDEPGERKALVDEQKRAAGEKIVKDTCTDCHSFAGDGDLEGANEAPELAGYGSIAWTTAQVANPASATTYRGHAGDPHTKGLMPRFDGELAPADIALVARWTRAHARGLPPLGAP
jgi:mono/diheme cytochrome c family protein